MPLFVKKTALLVKPEVTVGTDSVPTGAANAVQVDSITVNPINAKTAERNPIRPYFGGKEKVTASVYSTVEIELPFSGSGAAGTVPQWDTLMQICGASSTVVAATSVTYAPVSSALKTATVYVNVDGTNHIITSCRGTVELAANAEGLPVWKFMLTGFHTPLGAAGLPAVTYAGIADPVAINAANSTLTLHTRALVASAFGLKLGAKVMYRNRIGAQRVDLTDRESEFSCSFENEAVGTKDWIAAARTNAKGALAFVHGLTAGNIITINAAIAQLWTAQYGTDEDVQTIEATGGLLPGSGGNNEWSIVLT